jgi:hypothetical protein
MKRARVAAGPRPSPCPDTFVRQPADACPEPVTRPARCSVWCPRLCPSGGRNLRRPVGAPALMVLAEKETGDPGGGRRCLGVVLIALASASMWRSPKPCAVVSSMFQSLNFEGGRGPRCRRRLNGGRQAQCGEDRTDDGAISDEAQDTAPTASSSSRLERIGRRTGRSRVVPSCRYQRCSRCSASARFPKRTRQLGGSIWTGPAARFDAK